MDNAKLNGIRVEAYVPTTCKGAKKSAATIFIPLPRELWRAIDGQCGKCGDIPYWDTLAVSPSQEFTWTVHYPELQARA